LEDIIKTLEQENTALKTNSNSSYTSITQSKNAFNIPKKEIFKYGFAFFSFMALVCSLNMQNQH